MSIVEKEFLMHKSFLAGPYLKTAATNFAVYWNKFVNLVVV